MSSQPLAQPKKLKGRYLYCFIEADGELEEFDVDAVPHPGMPETLPVYPVVVGKIAAVVSDSPVIRYPITRNHLLAHEAVIKHVSQTLNRLVLPVKYGTVAANQQELVENLLAPRENELVELLASFRNKVEFSLKVMWEREVIFNRIAEEPAIKKLKAELAGKPENQSYQERIKLGQMVEQALATAKENDAAKVLERLRPVVRDIKIQPVRLDMLVLNVAVLLDADQEATFDAAIEELDAEMGEYLKFRYNGPVAPFSFINFSVQAGAEAEGQE